MQFGIQRGRESESASTVLALVVHTNNATQLKVYATANFAGLLVWKQHIPLYIQYTRG